MARKIAETPILKGKDAYNFRLKLEEDIKTPISKEERTEIKKVFDYFKSISNFEW